MGSMIVAVRATIMTVDGVVYLTDRHASVNLCLSQPADDHDEANRTLYSLRSGKSEAEV